VEISGQTYKLRYIGINTPETVDPRRPVECFGKEASAFNERLVLGRDVGLEKDISETDVYGRLLRYVWLTGPSTGSGQAEMVNATLVREGYAQASSYPPDVKYQDMFSSLQVEAAEAGRGLWGADCDPTPSPTALSAVPAPASTPTHPSP
jgi:micrococcal nuclease